MPKEDGVACKSNNFLKIIQLLDDYLKCFIVEADNAGSTDIADVHVSVREGCDVTGQEHHDLQGHSGASGKQP